MLIQGLDIINTCPHAIQLKDEEGNIHTIPQNPADLLRVHSFFEYGTIGPFKDAKVAYRFIEELPPQKENTVYVISAPTMAALLLAGVNRDDFRVLGQKDKDNPKVRIGLVHA